MCRGDISTAEFLELPPAAVEDILIDEVKDEDTTEIPTTTVDENTNDSLVGSSKCDALMELVETSITKDKTTKIVLFR